MADGTSDESESEPEVNGTKKPDIAMLAEKAGLSVKRYQRKLERGEIQFDSEGNPTAISKKDLKKAKKEAKKTREDKDEGKKRKRTAEGGEVDSFSKKKKKKGKE